MAPLPPFIQPSITAIEQLNKRQVIKHNDLTKTLDDFLSTIPRAEWYTKNCHTVACQIHGDMVAGRLAHITMIKGIYKVVWTEALFASKMNTLL